MGTGSRTPRILLASPKPGRPAPSRYPLCIFSLGARSDGTASLASSGEAQRRMLGRPRIRVESAKFAIRATEGFGRQMMVEQDRGVAGKVPAKLLVVDQCLVA